ncbi:MAG: copper oxidase, partial [Acidobacteriota bacterium]|nr:copper oxidase [Acidobacteriota bacterium]
MKRRDFFKLAGAAAVGSAATSVLAARPQNGAPIATPSEANSEAPTSKADITLRIAPVTVPLTPNHIISTIGYNGTSPGPILR